MGESNIAEPIAQLQIDMSEVKETAKKTVEAVDTLDGTADRMAIAIVNLQTDVSEIKETLNELPSKADFNSLITAQDDVLGALKIVTAELAATNHAILRHEDRIVKLEKEVFPEKHTHLA